jgi:hypothetical protein
MSSLSSELPDRARQPPKNAKSHLVQRSTIIASTLESDERPFYCTGSGSRLSLGTGNHSFGKSFNDGQRPTRFWICSPFLAFRAFAFMWLKSTGMSSNVSLESWYCLGQDAPKQLWKKNLRLPLISVCLEHRRPISGSWLVAGSLHMQFLYIHARHQLRRVPRQSRRGDLASSVDLPEVLLYGRRFRLSAATALRVRQLFA